MRILILTWSMGLFAGVSRAEEVKFDRDTYRRFAEVTKSICRGYLELFDPVAGVRELRARARADHNRGALAFEDTLLEDSTHPLILPVHKRNEDLLALAAREKLLFRVLVNQRRLYVRDEGLIYLPRGTALLIDPATGMVESFFKPGE